MSDEERTIIWSLELADGTKLENLTLHRNQFSSETLIDRTIFTKEAISKMIVDCDEETKKMEDLEQYLMEHDIAYYPGTILENVFMDAFWDNTRREGGVGCSFSFLYKTPQMMLRERMTGAEENIEHTNGDVTDIQEALVDIYETIIGG